MSSNLVLGNVVSDNSQDVSEASQTPESPPTVGSLKCAFSNSDGESAPRPAPAVPQTSLKPEHLQKRRSSSRSIKRKKFDDELVESSLVKTPRTRPLPGSLSTSVTQSVAPVSSSSAAPVLATYSDSSQVDPIVPLYSERKKLKQAAAKARKKSLPAKKRTAKTKKTATARKQTTGKVGKKAPAKKLLLEAKKAATARKQTTGKVGKKAPAKKLFLKAKKAATAIMQATMKVRGKGLPAKKRQAKSRRAVTATSKSTPKRVKKSSKNTQALVTKDLGRWKPLDDYALCLGVQQTNDLETVYRGVKFSCNFTPQEIKERWYALLYDPAISKMAIAAMKQLHPDVLASVQAKAIFSEEEEALLCTLPSATLPTLEDFQELLDKNVHVFVPGRTPKTLLNHWMLMRHYFLLPDQTVPVREKEEVLSFSDAEEALDDEDLCGPQDEVLEHELYLVDRNAKREIRQLENELPKWQVLVDSVIGVSPADFDNQTLAVLRGRLVRYLMRSKEITIGRVTKDNAIDVDLSLEGPSWKVSRRQGVIKLRNTGEFIIANEGKRPIYIDGKPVLAGNKHKLNNNSVVEIAGLRFVFLVNQDLISVIRSEAPQSS